MVGTQRARVQSRKPCACALALPPGTAVPQALVTSSGVRELLMARSQACPAACPAQLCPWLSTGSPRVPARRADPRGWIQPVARKAERLRHRGPALPPLPLDTTSLCIDAMTPALKIVSGQFDFLQISGWGHKNGDCSGEMG